MRDAVPWRDGVSFGSVTNGNVQNLTEQRKHVA